jgi:hypothetical protein
MQTHVATTFYMNVVGLKGECDTRIACTLSLVTKTTNVFRRFGAEGRIITMATPKGNYAQGFTEFPLILSNF